MIYNFRFCNVVSIIIVVFLFQESVIAVFRIDNQHLS